MVVFLFRRYRVKPALLEGESAEESRQRVLRTVEDLRVVILLQMMQPTNVSLIWTREEG